MVGVMKIIDINNEGWVLFHLKDCRYCIDVRKNMGVIKWMIMNKQECSNGNCPPMITSYPMWLNVKTEELWDGAGVFR
jgi:hypothetical protein